MTPLAHLPLAEVKAGDVLVPDAGFTCLPAGVPVTVQRDGWWRRLLPANILAWFGSTPSNQWPGGDLYINCDDGPHYLDGQISTTDPSILVGFFRAEAPTGDNFGGSDYELVGLDAELKEPVGDFPAGHRFSIMAVEGDKLELTDDQMASITVQRLQVRVFDSW